MGAGGKFAVPFMSTAGAAGGLAALAGPVGMGMAAFSAVQASQQNKALGEAGSAEAELLVKKAVDDKAERVNRFGVEKGLTTIVGASAGSGSGGIGGSSRNIGEQITAAAADATLDIGVIDAELKGRLDSLRNRIKSQGKNPLMEGFTSGLSTFGGMASLSQFAE